MDRTGRSQGEPRLLLTLSFRSRPQGREPESITEGLWLWIPAWPLRGARNDGGSILSLRGGRGYGRGFELHRIDGDGAEQGRHREAQRREEARTCHGRERDFDIAPAGNVFHHHAVGSVPRNGPQHDVADEHAAFIGLAGKL